MTFRTVSYAPQFLARVRDAVWDSIIDAADESARRPGSPGDLHAERTGPGEGRFGSNRPYAMAQERGAFITPRQGKALKYASGRFSKRSRIPATHYLERTGRRWGEHLLSPRLRGVRI